MSPAQPNSPPPPTTITKQQSNRQGRKTRSHNKLRDYVVHEIPSQGKKIQRWNDIKKYMYLPPAGHVVPLKKLTAKYEQTYIKDLHPLSVLTLEQL